MSKCQKFLLEFFVILWLGRILGQLAFLEVGHFSLQLKSTRWKFLLQITDSPFSQQEMKAVRPFLTAGNVMPLFLILGIVFIPVGIGMLVVSEATKELVRISFTNDLHHQVQRVWVILTYHFDYLQSFFFSVDTSAENVSEPMFACVNVVSGVLSGYGRN
jgi:hypothetical protein